MLETLRVVLPIVLTVAVVAAIDRAASRRGRQLPGLEPAAGGGARGRRAIALGALGIALYLGVFAPLGSLGLDREIDFSGVSTIQLFALHAVFVVALIVYVVAGSTGSESARRSWSEELGLLAPAPGREAVLGLAAGLVGWMVVLVLLSLLVVLVSALGGEAALPSQPPAMIVWMAGLHWSVRLALSLSAGLVEELFFRGLLQPRIGILGSSVLFVLAHAGYDQPFLLIGVAVLSFGFAALTAWRRTIWPAVVAHSVFDAVQLLILIPMALRVLEGQVA